MTVHIYRIYYCGKEWLGAYDFEPSYQRIVYDFWKETDMLQFSSMDHFTLEVKNIRE